VSSELPIEPTTKVATLLDHYPELEDVLIGMAEPFKKLKNPILRRSVAKVASLRQAAAVGRVPVSELVNKLRAVVGQAPISPDAIGEATEYFTDRPDWFDQTQVAGSIDERESQDGDPMPLATVLQKATALQPGEILELLTTFLPAPGIDIMKGKGYLTWSTQDGELVRTYFAKPAAR
jgi:hypothetical protein